MKAEGVFVEGNSFASFVDVDFFVMVRRAEDPRIKKSAKQVLEKADAVYVAGEDNTELALTIERIRSSDRERRGQWSRLKKYWASVSGCTGTCARDSCSAREWRCSVAV